MPLYSLIVPVYCPYSRLVVGGELLNIGWSDNSGGVGQGMLDLGNRPCAQTSRHLDN